MSEAVPPGSAAFPTTRWTLILSARSSPEARRAAMNALLTTYWKPLYVFLRRKGLDADRARDAVQDLVVQLIERDVVSHLAPERGRLRAYLRATAANYLANQHERATAKKHGGDAKTLSLDFEMAERLVADSGDDPERAFEKRWAVELMERALSRLAREYESGERTGPFELVLAFFGSGPPPAYKDAAAQYGMSIPQLKSFLHRARQRFTELVREEVGETVVGGEEANAELDHVIKTWSA